MRGHKHTFLHRHKTRQTPYPATVVKGIAYDKNLKSRNENIAKHWPIFLNINFTLTAAVSNAKMQRINHLDTRHTYQQSFRLRTITKTINTMDIYHRNNKIIEPPLCPRCKIYIETNAHLWDYQHTIDMIPELFGLTSIIYR